MSHASHLEDDHKTTRLQIIEGENRTHCVMQDSQKLPWSEGRYLQKVAARRLHEVSSQLQRAPAT